MDASKVVGLEVNAEKAILMESSKVVALEINAEKTKYMLPSHHRIAGITKTVKIFGNAVTDQDLI
jgi:hypothetical protein